MGKETANRLLSMRQCWRNIPRNSGARSLDFSTCPYLRAPRLGSVDRSESQLVNGKAIDRTRSASSPLNLAGQQRSSFWSQTFAAVSEACKSKWRKALDAYNYVMRTRIKLRNAFDRRVPITGRRLFILIPPEILVHNRERLSSAGSNGKIWTDDHPRLCKFKSVFDRVTKASGLDDRVWKICATNESATLLSRYTFLCSSWSRGCFKIPNFLYAVSLTCLEKYPELPSIYPAYSRDHFLFGQFT